MEKELEIVTTEVIDSDLEPVDRIVSEIIDSTWQIISEKIGRDKEPGDENDGDSSTDGSIKIKPKIFPCKICGKLFSQFQSASKHCMGEKEILSVLCPLCGKEIKEKRNLKRHIESHTVVKSKKKKGEPKCEGCGKVFSSNQKLVGHMVKYHGVKKQSSENTQVTTCSMCSFSHMSLSVVKTHFCKAHAQDVRVNCDLCDYYCLSKSGLGKHKKIAHKQSAIVGRVLMPPPAAASNAAGCLPQLVGQASRAAVNPAYQYVARKTSFPASMAPLPPPPAGEVLTAPPRYDLLSSASPLSTTAVSGRAQHNGVQLVRHQPLSSSENVDIDYFLSQNFVNSSFGLESIFVTDDGKEIMKL